MKIKDIARITSGSGVDSLSHTSIKYKTVKELGSSAPLRDLVLATVYEYDEPLSVLEITSHINNTLDVDFEEVLVRYNLDMLLKSDQLLMRKETLDERLLRANGIKPTMNKLANMYFRKGIGVPHRKTVELVPGVILKGPSSPRVSKTPKPAKQEIAKVASTPRSFSSGVDTAALDFLIEKIVAERTAELQRKLDEAEAKIAKFKKLLD